MRESRGWLTGRTVWACVALAALALLLGCVETPKRDARGNPVLDVDGRPVMVHKFSLDGAAKLARDAKDWTDATAPLLPPGLGTLVGLAGSLGVAVTTSIQAARRKRRLGDVVGSVELAKGHLRSKHPEAYTVLMDSLRAFQDLETRRAVDRLTGKKTET